MNLNKFYHGFNNTIIHCKIIIRGVVFFVIFFKFPLYSYSLGKEYNKLINDSFCCKCIIRNFYVKTSIIYFSSMITLYIGWYRNQELGRFHFFDDSKEWNFQDKLGHLYFSYILSDYFYKNLKAEKKGFIKSFLFAFFSISSIEILDGFGINWGFSYYDILFNFLGSFFYFINNFYFNNLFSLKISYYPTTYYTENPKLLGNTHIERFIKDYNGHTFWLNININKLFKRFPEVLSLSIGHSIDGFIRAEKGKFSSYELEFFKPCSQIFISLDVNINKFNVNKRIFNYMKELFNFLKFPFPAIEFSVKKKNFHLIYF
mgnify:CR=1 FL=1